MSVPRDFRDLEKNARQTRIGRMGGQTDGRTDGQTLIERCVDLSKNLENKKAKRHEREKKKKKVEKIEGARQIIWLFLIKVFVCLLRSRTINIHHRGS